MEFAVRQTLFESACVRPGSVWELSITSIWLYHEPKTKLKIKSIKNK